MNMVSFLRSLHPITVGPCLWAHGLHPIASSGPTTPCWVPHYGLEVKCGSQTGDKLKTTEPHILLTINKYSTAFIRPKFSCQSPLNIAESFTLSGCTLQRGIHWRRFVWDGHVVMHVWVLNWQSIPKKDGSVSSVHTRPVLVFTYTQMSPTPRK